MLRVQDDSGKWFEFKTDDELRREGLDRKEYKQREQKKTFKHRKGSIVVRSNSQLEADWRAFQSDIETRRPGSSTEPKAALYPSNQQQLPGRHSGGFYQARWNNLIAEKKQRGIPTARAIALVIKENPNLRESVVSEANSGR